MVDIAELLYQLLASAADPPGDDRRARLRGCLGMLALVLAMLSTVLLVYAWQHWF